MLGVDNIQVPVWRTFTILGRIQVSERPVRSDTLRSSQVVHRDFSRGDIGITVSSQFPMEFVQDHTRAFYDRERRRQLFRSNEEGRVAPQPPPSPVLILPEPEVVDLVQLRNVVSEVPLNHLVNKPILLATAFAWFSRSQLELLIKQQMLIVTMQSIFVDDSTSVLRTYGLTLPDEDSLPQGITSSRVGRFSVEDLQPDPRDSLPDIDIDTFVDFDDDE